MKIEVNISNLSKQVGPKEILFRNMNFAASNGDIVSIVGPNGSGKSTFLKVLSGVTKPSTGKIELTIDGEQVKLSEFHHYFGYVAPYLNLYEEFHPLEHIKVICKIRNLPYEEKNALNFLERFDLARHRLKPIKLFSSGMKQRMRIILSILSNPNVMLLDEPFSNLDDKGIDLYRNLIEEMHKNDTLIFIASNDEREISLSNKQINLRDFKK
jgi:ABC-type multidrug transport system ATPase subunit